jgi:hypothetical protein
MLRWLWVATRGYRLRPWKSPYLRWRVETYSGMPAESLDAGSFLRFLLGERRSLWAYLRWVGRAGKS